MSSSYRISLDAWLSSLDVRAFSVGDIGGSQLPVKGRTKTYEAGLTVVYDLEQPHINSPKPDVVLDLNTATVFPLSTHDLIFCLEVFEYIYDPAHAFYVIAQMLTTGGIAWVSFPSFYPLHQPIEDDALRYMPAGIIKLAEVVGLSVEQMIKRRPETNALEQAWSIERMRPAKGEDHHFTGFIVEFKK